MVICEKVSKMSLTVEQSQYSIAFKRMLKEQLIDRGITDERVLDAMRHTPRDFFVDEALKTQAYIDAPLQIGEGQTISQPYIVAMMTQALMLKGSERVLEVGTGCGYQTAILASLVQKVYTIERFKSLAMRARERLITLGKKNIVIRVGDGSFGWSDAAPFSAIIVTCAAPKIPETYLAQLAMGGRLVIPVSETNNEQQQNMMLVKKNEQGFVEENLGECRFVKLVGQHGYLA